MGSSRYEVLGWRLSWRYWHRDVSMEAKQAAESPLAHNMVACFSVFSRFVCRYPYDLRGHYLRTNELQSGMGPILDSRELREVLVLRLL